MTIHTKTIHVFKSSNDGATAVRLDKSIIRNNSTTGYSTNILLDTNILIDIEAAYRTKSRHKFLREAGVIELVKMVKAARNSSIFLSAGAAFQEIPPNRRSNIERAYNRFLSDYLPSFCDDPNSLPLSEAAEYEGTPDFSDLSPQHQQVISIPYASLLAANVLDRLPELSGFEKFALYFKYCAEVLDMVSLKELVIARYAFAPELGINAEVRDRRNSVRNNFFKLKKAARKNLTEGEAIIRISMNGAMDLRVIIASDIVNNAEEQFPLGLTKMDVWIATSDSKLYEFCQSCPGLIPNSGSGPMARMLDPHLDITKTDYWQKTLNFQEEQLERRLPRSLAEKRSMEKIVEAGFELERKIVEGSAAKFILDLA